MKRPESSDSRGQLPHPCLARVVVQALEAEPTLEAVTIDRDQQTISVATLGRTDVPRITERLTHSYEQSCAQESPHDCLLLKGGGDCTVCGDPLPAAIRKRVTFQHSGNQTTIARVTCPTSPKFWRWRNIPLPRLEPRSLEIPDADHDHDHHNADEWKVQLLLAVLCGVFGLLAAYAVPVAWQVPVFVLSYLAGAWFPTEEVLERLRQRAIDVHFLMIAVAAGSASIGAWGEGATLLFLFSLSGALEHYALGRTQKEIRSLFHDAPKVATVVDDSGHESELAVEKLRPGMRLLVKPGSQFPVDAELVKGATAADESNLTGEATPVEKKIGDGVLAGTINLWGAIECVVLRRVTESSLSKIIKLIKEAQHKKAPSQQFTDTFSTYYTYAALGLSFAMFFVWWLAFDLSPFKSVGEVKSAFYRTMTLLVVASPCALVLSIPSAVLAAIAWGAGHGVLFRGGAAVEKLAEVDVVCLDKTGTLTTGELRVEKVESLPPGREAEVARIAYSLEKLSTHPLARAITRYGKQQKLEAIEFEHFESVTGQGLLARRNGAVCRLGKREWVLERQSADGTHQKAGVLPSLLAGESPASTGQWPVLPGVSEIWISEGALLGRILLRDDIRPQSRGVVDELRAEGLRSVVLTGDRKAAAEHLREDLHLDDVRGELKPEQKVEAIRALTAEGRKVAMIGDGVNDAPSLAASHVGVAMGARGSDAALEQADVVLMHDRLENFLAAFRLSVRARRIIRQNLFISLGTVVVLVAFAMAGKIPLTLGVVGHEGSTVIVVMNSLRLLLGGARQGRTS